MSNKSDSRIYIGNLPPDVRTKDLEDLFYKYGKIRFVDLKNRKGPPFAFVEYEDPLDAEDAIKGRDNYEYEGYRLRVEFQKGARGGRGGGGGGRDGGGGGGFSRNNNNAPPRRSENRVVITGLPPTGSWQDLKDHMRVAGNVCYADVFKDGTGVVEFIRYEDAKYAVKHLDDTKFRSHEGDTSYVRVRMDSKRRSPVSSRSRSRSPRSRSRSRSKRRGRERSSPSYSPVRKSRSRSGSRGSSRSDRNGRSKRSKRETSKSKSRSRSRSRSVKSKSKSRSRSRSRSKSPAETAAAASRSRSRSPARSRSKSKSPTAEPAESNTSGAGADDLAMKEEGAIANGYEN